MIFLTSNRIRKIKCDEHRPACQKCSKTGRTCDGYETPFRIVTIQPIKNVYDGSFKSGVDAIDPRDIDLLNRYFSTKTLFNVKLGCDEKAKQVRQASFTDPALRHAISSLRVLREDLEVSGNDPLSGQTSIYDYGLEEYGLALRGVASNLSTSSFFALKSALMCCQVFFSIEQV